MIFQQRAIKAQISLKIFAALVFEALRFKRLLAMRNGGNVSFTFSLTCVCDCCVVFHTQISPTTPKTTRKRKVLARHQGPFCPVAKP